MQITACLGSVGGGSDVLFRAQPSEVTGGEKEEGEKGGCKHTVDEAFAGRTDTKPQELEDGRTSFRMGHQFYDNCI